MDGFSFCIFDKDTELYTDVEYLTIEDQNITPQKQLEFITKSFNNHVLLNDVFDSVNVTHSNNLSTFVPKPFFNQEHLPQYLQFNVKVLENDFIAHEAIENIDIENVYIPFIHLNNFLFDKFGSFEYKHTSSVLVETLLKYHSNSEKTRFLVHVENDCFQIVILKNKKLEFYNTFNFKTKEDFIYYILYTAEQIQLNPEELQLTFLGAIEKESELYRITYQYVRNVDFFISENKSTEGLNISKHSYFTLLNQY